MNNWEKAAAWWRGEIDGLPSDEVVDAYDLHDKRNSEEQCVYYAAKCDLYGAFERTINHDSPSSCVCISCT